MKLHHRVEGGAVPKAALGCLVRWLIDQQQFLTALAVFLSFDCYLRESDWEGLTAGDVIITNHGPGNIFDVALFLGVGSRGESSKTGSDQGVVMDDPS